MWIYCFAEFGFCSKTSSVPVNGSRIKATGNWGFCCCRGLQCPCQRWCDYNVHLSHRWAPATLPDIYHQKLEFPSQSQFRATCRSISYKKSPSLTRIWYPSSGMNPVMPQSYPLQYGRCTSHLALLKSCWRPTFAVCSSRSKIWTKICWPKIGTSKLISQPISHRFFYFSLWNIIKSARFSGWVRLPPPRLRGFRAHLFSLKTLTAVGITFQLEGQKAPNN